MKNTKGMNDPESFLENRTTEDWKETRHKKDGDRFANMCVCLCACIFVCMYVCMYIYMYVNKQSHTTCFFLISKLQWEWLWVWGFPAQFCPVLRGSSIITIISSFHCHKCLCLRINCMVNPSCNQYNALWSKCAMLLS